MSEKIHAAPSSPAILGEVTVADLRKALSAGYKDFRRAPMFGLFFAAFFVLGGIVIYLELTIQGRELWVIPLALGFPMLAPFLAVGLYEVSRRLEKDEELDWAAILGVIFRQKDRQCPSMAMVLIMFFMFWVFIAHMVFALFMGLEPMVNVLTNWQDTILTQSGITMLAVGSLVGTGMGLVLYALTVVSLPMLLDREMDFITAMINSFQLVAQNRVVLLGWAAMIGALVFIAMLPFFLGLFLVLPVLGHATWHLYRNAIRFED